MVKLKFIGLYPKRTEVNGVPTSIVVYKYTVHGTDEQIAQYREFNEKEGIPNYSENGHPILFTTRNAGVSAVGDFSSNGNLFVKDDELTMLTAEMSTEQDPIMKAEIAKEIRAIKKARTAEIANFSKKGATVNADVASEDADLQG